MPIVKKPSSVRDVAVLIMSVMLCSTATQNVYAENVETRQSAASQEMRLVDDAVLDTIAQINHINWIVNTIKTYNNSVVLKEEYEKITPSKLNLNRIPDEETLERIKHMLDTLHQLLMEERELAHWRDTFDAQREMRMRQFWVRKLTSIDGGKMIDMAKGCLPIGPEAAIPYATVARVAWTCAATAVSTYNDYEDLVGSIESQAGERVFSFETSKLDRLHEQNKQLLDDQWRLIRKHGLDDALRVSDADIKQLISFLKDEDHERVYSLIEPMREKFKMFPDYWYYLSCVAMETQRNEIGLEACETFFRINRGLFRDDPMVGGVALNKAFMLPKTEENKAEVKRCLELSEKHNSGCTDWRRDYLAAIIWAEYLKDSKRAEKVIAHAVSSLEVKIKEVLQRAGGETIDSALGESLWVCRRLAEKLGKEGLAADDAHLRSLCQQMLTSSVEKLYYLGRMRAADVWAVMKDDVLKVSLDMNSELSAKGDAKVIQATLPVSWFLTGGLELNLSVFQGEVRLKEIPETINHRRANVGRTISVGFEIDKADLEKADSFRLDLKHPEYPVFFTFASATPYGDADKAGIAGKLHVFEGKLSAGNLAKDLFLYTVSFCGTSYHWDPSSGRLADRKYSSKADPAGWASSFMGVFENLEPIKEVYKRDKGLVKSLTYDAAKQAFTLRYENTSDKPIKPAVSLYFLNRYGSVTARFDDAWFWKSIAPGESHEQVIPAGSHGKPHYVDIEDGAQSGDDAMRKAK